MGAALSGLPPPALVVCRPVRAATALCAGGPHQGPAVRPERVDNRRRTHQRAPSPAMSQCGCRGPDSSLPPVPARTAGVAGDQHHRPDRPKSDATARHSSAALSVDGQPPPIRPRPAAPDRRHTRARTAALRVLLAHGMGDGGRVGPRRHFSKSCRSGGGWVSKRHRPAGRIRRRRGSGRTRPASSVGWRRSHHPTNRHRTARRPTWIRAPDIPVGTPPVPLGCSKACTGPRTPTRSRPLFGIDRDVCEPTNISWLRTAHPDTYDPRRASPTLIPKCPGREARTADVSSRSLGRPTGIAAPSYRFPTDDRARPTRC